jgi:hypothetical protein
MSASAIVTESLDWVTFSGKDEPCDALDGGCLAEAVALAIWLNACDCARAESRLCVRHRDYVLQGSLVAGGMFLCRTCATPAWLVRIEPIR